MVPFWCTYFDTLNGSLGRGENPQARLGGRSMTNTPNPHEGSTLYSLLEADGVLAEAQAVAVKRVCDWQAEQDLDQSGRPSLREGAPACLLNL